MIPPSRLDEDSCCSFYQYVNILIMFFCVHFASNLTKYTEKYYFEVVEYIAKENKTKQTN